MPGAGAEERVAGRMSGANAHRLAATMPTVRQRRKFPKSGENRLRSDLITVTVDSRLNGTDESGQQPGRPEPL